MSHAQQDWGLAPPPSFETIAAPFRPIFARIAAGALSRENERVLPVAEIEALKQAGFGALRLPVEAGGAGADLPTLFRLLIELSEADSNITQALRGHFGLAEDIVNSRDQAKKKRWYPRFAAGEIAGNAWSEIGNASIEGFSTRVTVKDGKHVLNGTKYYTTGSLYADWIDVGAAGPGGEGVSLALRRHQPGVEIRDDWDGFGQRLTASGTTVFTDAEVDPLDIVPDQEKFGYGTGFYQLFHVATLAGIGRAITRDVSRAVAARTRSYSHAAADRVSQDPQILAIVGRIRSAAYAASVLTLAGAEALQRAHEAEQTGDADLIQRALIDAEIETAQAQTIAIPLILEAATVLFDTLGASAVKADQGLDRHWRNARTLSSHNPVVYKHRIIGDFSVNGTPPLAQWRIGQRAAA